MAGTAGAKSEGYYGAESHSGHLGILAEMTVRAELGRRRDWGVVTVSAVVNHSAPSTGAAALRPAHRVKILE